MTDPHNKIIDPHLHLFNLQKGNYAWLKPQNPPFWPDKHLINKSFIEADLWLQQPNHLSGFVHIEAGFDNQQPWREIDWLDQHCTLPFKSVAFADITTTNFGAHVDQLKQYKSLAGIRHILDEQAEQILRTTLVHQHFALLSDYELSFDDLVRSIHGAPLFKKPEIGNNPFKPVDEIAPEKNNDLALDIFKVIVAQYERGENFTEDKVFPKHLNCSRIIYDIHLMKLIKEGLAILSHDYVSITEKGKQFAANQGLVS
jgi:hypothetical protein